MESNETTNGGAPELKKGCARYFAGELYYDTARAAEFAGIHEQTILKASRDGQITSMFAARSRWYKPEWIRDYIAERTTIGTYKAQRRPQKRIRI